MNQSSGTSSGVQSGGDGGGSPPLPSFVGLYINNCIAGGIGIFLNLILISLIRWGSPAELKDFKRFLATNCVVDSAYAITTVLTQTVPMPDPGSGMLFMIPLGPVQLVDSWFFNAALICTYYMLNLSAVMTLPFTYIFRYLIICRQIKMTWKKFSLMFLFMFIFNFVYFILFCVVSGKEPIASPQLNAAIDQLAIVKNPSGRYNFVAADTGNLWSSILLHYPLGVIGLLYLMTITMAILIQRYVASNRANMGERSVKMQSQLTWTLSIQTGLPIVVLLLPMVLNTVLVGVFSVDRGNAALIALMSQARILYFAVAGRLKGNSYWRGASIRAVAMVFVVPYRRILKRFFLCQYEKMWWTSSKSVQSVARPQQQQSQPPRMQRASIKVETI